MLRQFESRMWDKGARVPDPLPHPHRARTRPQAHSQMGLSGLQIPTRDVTIHFTATYAAVTLVPGQRPRRGGSHPLRRGSPAPYSCCRPLDFSALVHSSTPPFEQQAEPSPGDGGVIWSDTKKIQKNNQRRPSAAAAGAGGMHNAEKGVTITISALPRPNALRLIRAGHT